MAWHLPVKNLRDSSERKDVMQYISIAYAKKCILNIQEPEKKNPPSQSESCSVTLCNPMDYTVHGILQARILEWVAFPFSRGSSQPRDLPNPGIKPRSPTLQADSLPAEPQGKPRNTGVGSLSLLQQIFLTQESNQGLLHCRQILYQLSYQRSPAS